MAYVNHLLTFIESNPALAVGFNLILLLLSGIFAHLLCKFLLIKVVRKVFFSSHKQDVPLEKDRRIAEKLSNFIPVIIVYYVLQFMPAMPASLVTAINTICGILFFIFMSVFFNEMLDIVNSSYLRKTKRKNHSIKGYIQIGKILVHILAAIMILAVMSNKSPIIIISSLGAVAAVLMIVFQHTLLSLVANVQLSSNDVLQLGDWIEMPDKNLSGEVTDIALHTITIRNWDNTISRIPTKNFLTMESFVAIMALVAACIIDPGVYFAMNSPMAVLAPAGTTDVVASAAQVVSGWGFSITPDTLHQIASEVGEQSIISRAGGAPTLAVGMAYILHGSLGGLMDVSFWYHFAILFEALFILTAVDAGTRAARFMLQDLLGVISPGLKKTSSLPANLLATALCVLAWGYFLHQGVVDPLGGINTLWPLFGIANQMLAGMALMLCAVVLFKMKRQRYAWVALLPTSWLLICTLTAGWQKSFSPDTKVGFLAIANKFQAMIDSGNIPPQYTESQLAQLVFNNRLDAGLTIFFMIVVVVLALFSIKTALAALKEDKPTAKETPYEPMPENLDAIETQAKGAH